MKLYHIVFFLIALFVSCDVLESCGTPSPTTPEGGYIVSPTLIYPGRMLVGASRSPLFIWDGHLDRSKDGSFNFELYLFNNDGSIIWQIDVGADTTVQFPDTLEVNTRFTWHVYVTASGGRDELSARFGFTTGTGYNNPPLNPIIIYPLFMAVEVPHDTVLSWYSFDPDGDDLTFDLWYRREQDSDSTLITGLAVDEYSILLDADTRYYWFVTAFDEHGASAFSWEDVYFTTILTDPPHDPSPPDSSDNILRNVTLRWNCSDPDGDVLTYDVAIGPAGGTLVIIGEDLSDNHFDLTNLDYSTDYDWMVTAKDDDGHYTSGAVWSFRTEIDQGAYNGIYAELMIHRSQWGTSDNWTRNDYVSARFDSVYAPDSPIVPKRPTAVYVGTEAGWVLQWQDYQYYYSNPYVGYFLGRGASYFLTITGGDDVPSLVTDSIILPKCRLEITSPEAFSWISMDEGFELVWIEYDDACPDCDRDITIRIMDMGPIEWTDVNIVTENDGSYTFTADDLSGIDPAAYSFQIVLIIDNKEIIIAPGYDPRSWIWARVYTTQFIYKQ